KGREVASVDPDHGRAEPRRPRELVEVVRLDERVETDRLRVAHQRRARLVVEVAEDQQCRVGAGLAQLAEVILGGEEALREERDVGQRARGPQIAERAAEPLVDEHGDRARVIRRVRRDDLLDPRIGPDVAHRRRPSLELRDRAQARPREGVGEPHERENSTSSSSRAAAAPESIDSRARTIPSRRFSAWPAAAMPPAALRTTAARCAPSAPSSTARSAFALCAGSPPRSSAASWRSTPRSSGSSSYSRTLPFSTSHTRLGPAGDSSSVPPAPGTTDARVTPSRTSASASVRVSSGE